MKTKETINSIKRTDLNRNISRFTRKNERKNEKLRTNFILFGAKHLRSSDMIIEDVCWSHS